MKAEDKAKIESAFNRAIKIWHEGDDRAAILMLERLAVEYPNNPAILGVLGGIYYGLEEYKISSDYFQRTLALSPKSDLASRGLFFSLRNIGKSDEAISEMERFLPVSQSEEYDFLVREALDYLGD
jgi:tetratricopeptide (TPR) repeat protein